MQTAFALAMEETGLKVTVDAGPSLSPALMLDILRQVFMLPADMFSGVLLDLRAGKTDPRLDDAAVGQIAAYVRARQSERPVKLRLAFVVDRERSIDVMRRVAFLTESLPPKAAVFQAEADAWRWLAEDEERR
jgi:hypothetical protein